MRIVYFSFLLLWVTQGLVRAQEPVPAADRVPAGRKVPAAGETPSTGKAPSAGKIPAIDKTAVKVDDLLWDFDRLSVPPGVEWLDRTGPVHSLLYESVDYEGKPTQVFAWYSNPDLLAGRPASDRKFPGVVLVHGGGGKAFRQWVEKWAADGYAAIAMDLSGNGPDGKKLDRPGPDQADTNKFARIRQGNLRNVWTYHAVSSVLLAHSLLLNLPEVDTGKTCITGISWGGYLTCIAASLDNRFKAAAPVYGCAFYDESDVFGKPLDALPANMKQEWMHYFDPSVYLPFARPAFLFVNGNKDRFYNVVPYHKTYSLISPSRRTICIKPDMVHSHNRGWEPREIRYFFESVINGAAPLATAGPPEVKEGQVSVSYHTPVALLSAEFYYSTDTLSSNQERSWKMQRVSIDPRSGRISCPVPKGGFRYGFFHLLDNRYLEVSSEFLVR